MARLHRLLLIFSLLFAAPFVIPAFLDSPFFALSADEDR
jgi:hypothetical protein